MQQLSLIDPREQPVATAAMLGDLMLQTAIRYMRTKSPNGRSDWPFVEYLVEVEGRPAWAIDDGGERYVVIWRLIFRPEEFDILDAKIRTAALEAFGRLDAINALGGPAVEIPQSFADRIASLVEGVEFDLDEELAS